MLSSALHSFFPSFNMSKLGVFIHADLEMAYLVSGEAALISAAAWVSLMPHGEGFLCFQSRLLLRLLAPWPHYITLTYCAVVSVLSALTGCIMAIWWLQCITETDSSQGVSLTQQEAGMRLVNDGDWEAEVALAGTHRYRDRWETHCHAKAMLGPFSITVRVVQALMGSRNHKTQGQKRLSLHSPAKMWESVTQWWGMKECHSRAIYMTARP